jgi:hypothetical protein
MAVPVRKSLLDKGFRNPDRLGVYGNGQFLSQSGQARSVILRASAPLRSLYLNSHDRGDVETLKNIFNIRYSLFNIHHSLLRLFTGFANPALMACQLTVSRAMERTTSAAPIMTHGLTLIR